MNTRRSYTMGARAKAVEETRRRIVDAAVMLCGVRVLAEVSLDDVAREAGVSVQTVLRQFGSKAALIEAATDYALGVVAQERTAPSGDVETAIRVLVDHYEQRGRASLLMLAQETVDEQMARVTAHGRRLHRDWVEGVFAPYAAGDAELIDLLVVATDVYTWKLLRLDRGHSRARTERRIKTLVSAVLAQESGKD